jgi:Flp pilus assembly protein TadD
MSVVFRAFAALSLLWLAGCQTFQIGPEATTPLDAHAEVIPPQNPVSALITDPNDDLALGKRMFRDDNIGLAATHFRRAIEKGPSTTNKDAEAWLGLAASYDKLRRFDLADRAYRRVTALLGPTPEILNNQGYSYLLRGDYKRARIALDAARAKAPDDVRIRNNLDLLERSAIRGG